jgi:2-methylcitrate dehydratase PrpD
MHDNESSLDRRSILGASALTVLAMAGEALAQQPGVPNAPDARKLTRLLAEYIVGFDLKNVPEAVIDRSRIALIDTIGVMLAGSHEEVSHIALEMVKAEAAAPTTSIVGQSLRTSPQLAALANGVAGHAMDYDISYISGQVMAALVPAALPMAETTKASAAELMAAHIIGAEVSGRISRANFRASSIGGWHTTGIIGVFAAAAAAARLLKLPVDVIADVLGISASLASGITVNFGTMTKPLHSGQAARNGIMAAMLGQRGFTAHAAALEAPAGYFSTFGRGLDVTFEPFGDLGRRYDLVTARFDIKAYPCGGLTHTAIEAALQVRDRVATRLNDIRNIHCFVTRNAGQRAGTQYPSTVEAAKFSVAYLVPYALIHGAPRITAFTEKAIADERIKALAKTVTASVDPDLGPGTDGSPARIRITFTDGQVIEQFMEHSSGSRGKPMTQAQIDAKFLDCAAQVMPEDVSKKILTALKAFPEQKSLDDFWPLLRKA